MKIVKYQQKYPSILRFGYFTVFVVSLEFESSSCGKVANIFRLFK